MGTTPTTFAPNMRIPKDQLTVLSSRVLRNQMRYRVPSNPASYLSGYNDWQSIPEWSRADIALATRENIIVPRVDGRFAPNDTMTRGDAALILHRLYLRIW